MNQPNGQTQPNGHNPHLILGKYQPMRELGRGAMGVVLEARDEQGNLYAIKQTLCDDMDSLMRFKREGKILMSARHPGIVRAYEFHVQGNKAIIVQEKVEGKDLQDIITDEMRHRRAAEGFVPEEEEIDQAIKMAEALRYAHQKLHTSHRDIKPANIMIDQDGNPKILDFGIAKEPIKKDMTSSTAGLTLDGTILGTPVYMAPEQALGHIDGGRFWEQAGAHSDVYSLGGVLMMRWGHQTPIPTKSNQYAQLEAVLSEEIPGLQSLNPGIPDDLADIVDLMLLKDPEKRMNSMSYVIARLKRFKKEHYGAREVIAGPQRNTGLIAGVASAATAGALLLGYVVFGGDKPVAPTPEPTPIETPAEPTPVEPTPVEPTPDTTPQSRRVPFRIRGRREINHSLELYLVEQNEDGEYERVGDKIHTNFENNRFYADLIPRSKYVAILGNARKPLVVPAEGELEFDVGPANLHHVLWIDPLDNAPSFGILGQPPSMAEYARLAQRCAESADNLLARLPAENQQPIFSFDRRTGLEPLAQYFGELQFNQLGRVPAFGMPPGFAADHYIPDRPLSYAHERGREESAIRALRGDASRNMDPLSMEFAVIPPTIRQLRAAMDPFGNGRNPDAVSLTGSMRETIAALVAQGIPRNFMDVPVYQRTWGRPAMNIQRDDEDRVVRWDFNKDVPYTVEQGTSHEQRGHADTVPVFVFDGSGAKVEFDPWYIPRTRQQRGDNDSRSIMLPAVKPQAAIFSRAY